MFLELFKYLIVYTNIDLGVVGQDIGSVPISLGSDGELGCLPGSTLLDMLHQKRHPNVNSLGLTSNISRNKPGESLL